MFDLLKSNLSYRACHLVTDQKSLKLLQFKQRNVTNDVMCMDMKYGCGVDLRFQSNGKVAIMLETEIISRYGFEQMAGRVHRDKYFPICNVFTTTGKATETGVEKDIMARDDNELKDGVSTLRLVRQHKQAIIKGLKERQEKTSVDERISCFVDLNDFKNALAKINIIV